MVAEYALPLVDLTNLDSPDLRLRERVAGELDRACRDTGFLYVQGAQIDPTLFDDLLGMAKAYFRQDIDAKMRDYIGLSRNHSGYVPIGEEQFASGTIDMKEAYDVNHDYLLPGGTRPLLGQNLWPDLPGFRETVLAYYRHMKSLGHKIFGAFAMALGLEEDFFAPHLRHPPSQLRLIHYPLDTQAEDGSGIGAHTDYECFTLLLPTAPGLQVIDKAGEWIDVPLVENTMVMNIGDMMEILSNGRYLATKHRVRRIREERYSFPLFFSCDYDYVIRPIVEGEAPRYAPLRGGEHLFAQTAQTFAYLKKRVASGELALSDNLPLDSFGLKA